MGGLRAEARADTGDGARAGEEGSAGGFCWRHGMRVGAQPGLGRGGLGGATGRGCGENCSGWLAIGTAAFGLFLICFFFFFPSMFLIVFSEAAGKMEMLSKNIFVSMNLC